MAENKNWKCPNCGADNKGDFDVCFSCGYVRAVELEPPTMKAQSKPTIKKTEPVKKPIKEPAKQTEKSSPTKASKKQGSATSGKKTITTVLIAVFVLLGLVIALFAYNSKIEKQALELEANGKYAEAVAEAKKILLFSNELTKERYIAQAVEHYDSKNYDEAIEILLDFKGDEEADKHLNRCYSQKLDEYMRKGDYQKALNEAKNIFYPYINVVPKTDKAHLMLAIEQIDNANYDKAIEELSMIKNDPCAKPYIDVLNALKAQSFTEAALYAVEVGKNFTSTIDTTEWKNYIYAEIEREKSSNKFDIHKAKSIFTEKPDFLSDSCKLYFNKPSSAWFSQSPKHGQYDIPTEKSLTVIDDVANASGKKVIVIWQLKDYDTGKVTNYIAWDIMEQLPLELMPDSFDEVGKIIRIVGSGNSEGFYRGDNGPIAAVVESGQVCVGTKAYLSDIYCSSVKSGPECPNTIFYRPIGAVYGGFPNMEEELIIAIRTVLGL